MQIFHNQDLQSLNTFGIAATAATFIVLETPEDISHALKEYGQPSYILGTGSNILITRNIEGVIWQPAFHGIIQNTSDTATNTTISLTIGAGETMNDIVYYTAQQGRWGIENLVAIPGCVGAAPIQNIGAYGVELKDVFVSCTTYDLQEKKVVSCSKEECHFGYRDSIFKQQPNRYLIIDVTITLSKNPKPVITYGGVREALIKKGYINEGDEDFTTLTPLQIADTIEEIRRSKLPKPEELGNTGSFFKNPFVDNTLVEKLLTEYPTMPHFPETITTTKIPAARLIENAGLKGYREGNVGTYEKQPLIIVNYGGATGEEMYDFSEKTIHTVQEKFGVTLEREVNVW